MVIWGRRLKNAGEILFGRDPDAGILTIGTDCIEIDREILSQAWDRLERDPHCVVLGPTADGGYYLIGSREPVPELFTDIPWSTDQTFSATVTQAEKFRKNCYFLPEKIDIDTVDEYQRFEERLTPRPCVFFDRDGVVNISPGDGYVLKKDDFHLSDGILESLEAVRKAGCFAIVVTSQKGVGKKLMTEHDLRQIHHHLQSELSLRGLAFDGIFSYTGSADCDYAAKPDPAMIHACCK